LLIGWEILRARRLDRHRVARIRLRGPHHQSDPAFFAIPILAVTKLRFGDIVGYTFIVALACFVVTLVAMGLISPHL
jgi:hypothetical protein